MIYVFRYRICISTWKKKTLIERAFRDSSFYCFIIIPAAFILINIVVRAAVYLLYLLYALYIHVDKYDAQSSSNFLICLSAETSELRATSEWSSLSLFAAIRPPSSVGLQPETPHVPNIPSQLLSKARRNQWRDHQRRIDERERERDRAERCSLRTDAWGKFPFRFLTQLSTVGGDRSDAT